MDSLQKYRRDFLRSVRDALELLLHDQKLREDGFEYHDVVDFAAIYAYIYKEPSAPFIKLVGEPDELTFARRQMALQRLFSSYPRKLLLIPPYATELSNHLQSMSTTMVLARTSLFLYKEQLTRMITNSKEFQDFVDNSFGTGTQLTSHDLRQAALKVGKEFFPELYAAMAYVSAEVRETFNNLFRKNILYDADEELPECRDIDYSSDRTNYWYKIINTSRNGKRAVQSWTDAMACAYIEAANARLNPKRRIVVFVSPSASVKAALAERPLISDGTQAKMNVTRDLTYCFLASIHKDNRDDVNLSLTRVNRLLELYESLIPIEWNGPDKREEAAALWKGCENLFAMNASAISEVQQQKGLTNQEAGLLRILRELYAALTEGRDGIAEQIAADFSTFNDTILEANKLMPALPAEQTREMYRSIKVTTSGRKELRIVFPGLSDELPIVLAFVDKNVVRLAQAFENIKRSDFSDSNVMLLRTDILDAASRSRSTPEHHLLAGYILALEGRYEAALAELETGSLNADREELLELTFVSAAIHRKMYHAKEACELLTRALEIDPGDPRINLEMAKSLWVRWRDQRDGRATDKSLEEALDHLKIASESTSTYLNKELRAQIENVAAFVYTERARAATGNRTTKDLDQALSHIRNLESLLPETEWVGRFYDTRSYWHIARAESTPDLQEKQRLLDAADRDNEKSLKFKEDSAAGLEVRREHQELIRRASAGLPLPALSKEA